MVFSRTGESADAVIERLVTEQRLLPRAVTVVTSDRTIRATVGGVPVTRISSDVLVADVNQLAAEYEQGQRRAPDAAHAPGGPHRPGRPREALAPPARVRLSRRPPPSGPPAHSAGTPSPHFQPSAHERGHDALCEPALLAKRQERAGTRCPGPSFQPALPAGTHECRPGLRKGGGEKNALLAARPTRYHVLTRRHGSMAEQRFCKPWVGGSTPSAGSRKDSRPLRHALRPRCV